MAVAIGMAKDHGPAMHPFFMPKSSLEPSAETDFDQNEGRRKRQRTRSPEPEASTSINLITSTRPDHPEVVTGYIPTEIDIKAIGTNAGTEESKAHIDGNIDSVEAQLQSKSRRNVTATVGDFVSESKDNGHLLCEVQEQNPRATPPKKMLRVRPDGRLGSPKAKEPTQDVKPRRGRKPGKAEASLNKLVAVIKYGKDDDSRRSIGRRLDDIILGTASIQGPVKNKPSKPTEPLKPTHPFFLGGSALVASQPRRTTSSDLKSHDSESSVSNEQKGTISPRKARVISKPPDIADNQARATPFGLGSHAFGTDHARVTRFPGAIEPVWPPADMLHVGRPKESTMNVNNSMRVPQSTEPSRKLKGLEVRVPEREDVLAPFVNLVRSFQSNDKVFQKVNSRDWREFRRPKRLVMNGHELQKAIHPRLVSRLDAIENGDVDELSIPQPVQSPAHVALQHLYGTIATSLSSFDKFACERQDWMHKYAPKAAEDVLQQSHEVCMLRDWLKGSTIRSVEFRDHGNSSRASSVASKKRGPKKRKRAEELDGFVISSDEEASLMDEITDSESLQPRNSLLKKSVIRSADATGVLGTGGRSTNAVVISGPHGCGKTAAVYAVAQELGFEVFEINAASRRSGRDILDRVGDMTRNHLVRQDPRDEVTGNEETAEQQRASEQLKQDLESGRQGTMNSFFKSAKGIKSKRSAKKSSPQKIGPEANEQPKKQQSQKQSLILLEEVDVLFEEDKLFWATVLELTLQSKRPIIMTCTDERLLPLDDIALHAIFRFGPPPDPLAVDYLLLVACNEGHLLPREAVSALYNAKRSDLRASIAELNFWCQMAIGDVKGGLEWMLIRSTADEHQEPESEYTRVVSEGTYQNGMGWLSGDLSSEAEPSISQETELLLEAWHGWGIDVGAHNDYVIRNLRMRPEEISGRQAIEELERFEQACEALSAADTYPACVSRVTDMISLENAPPVLTERTRNSYVEGSNILQADPVVDQTGLSDSVAIIIRTCAQRLLKDDQRSDTLPPIDRSIISIIGQVVQGSQHKKPFTKSSISPAFDPISRSQKAVLGIPKGPQISAFDGPLSVLAEDLAPYVRSIVSYDLRLEDQRHQLSSLLSQPGKNGKKARTTRASRAALEGGSKANTRRERWFPNNTNFDAVLETGGKEWQDVLLQRGNVETSGNCTGSAGSCRSSLESAMGSDA